ncbi:hypothetical protein BHE74_00038439 [Ensete ventricosum]|nr:hypothetical protein BHE74_00038439 [Ensete ventricosum]RZR91468.1 hypothetical protein BHM03_00019586 [Ensete ventricosum]
MMHDNCRDMLILVQILPYHVCLLTAGMQCKLDPGWIRASDYGIVKIDKVGQIIQFSEKPKGADLEAMAYIFEDYWDDIGTIKSFYDANLALTEQVNLI